MELAGEARSAFNSACQLRRGVLDGWRINGFILVTELDESVSPDEGPSRLVSYQ